MKQDGVRSQERGGFEPRLVIIGWLVDLVQDVRFAARSLVKNPGFTITTVATLALATGATTAIFSIVNSVLLRPLPFPAADRLVQVYEIAPVGGAGPVLPQDLVEFRRQATLFDGFTGYGLTTRHLQGAGGNERVTAVIADNHFFSVLGAQPIVGRTFRPDDVGAFAVMSARFWHRRFGGDPSIVGKSLPLDGNVFDPALKRSVIQRESFTVLGVMPESFQFPYAAGSVYPSALPESQTDIWLFDGRSRGGRMNVTARLKPGVTIDASASELGAIELRLDEMMASPYRPLGVSISALGDVVIGTVRRSLWLLFAAVGLVLAAACANVANLLLARVNTRMQEVVTRLALGAGRARLIRQFLAESVVLSLCGGGIGIAIAIWAKSLLVTLGAAKIPRAHEIVLDWRAFGFLLLVCLATAVFFGLAPAMRAARTNVQDVTRSSRYTADRGFVRLRDGLAIVEIALAFLLAVGAAAVLRELNRLHQVDAGIVTDNVLTLHLTPRISDSDYFRIEEEVARLPGVGAAGLCHMVPLQNWGGIGTFEISGRPRQDPSRQSTAELRSVTPGFFTALGIPLRKGRDLSERDSLSGAPGILINETLERLYFAGEDPLGRETNRGIIVGVVGDVRNAGLDRVPQPQIYSPVNANAGIAADIGMSLFVRTHGSPEALVDAVRAAVQQVNPTVAIFNVRTLEQVVADSLWELNLYRWLLGLFAALALLLAAIGLYGVISYGVTARSREFAVRLAVGCGPRRLAGLVLGRALQLASVGLAIGIAVTVVLTRTTPNLPPGMIPGVSSLTIIVLLLLAIALLAAMVPARRVAAIDPANALRHE